LRCFSYFTSQEHFIHDGINLVEVKHKIQLANVVEKLVENFDEIVDGFEVGQIIVANIHANAEIKSSITPINDFETAEFDKVGVLGITDCDESVDLLDQLLLFVVIEVHVPFRKPRLASSVLYENKTNHFCKSERGCPTQKNSMRDRLNPSGIEHVR
jgi:hypothetical protein